MNTVFAYLYSAAQLSEQSITSLAIAMFYFEECL